MHPGTMLTDAVRDFWPTALTTDGNGARPDKGEGSTGLNTHAQQWATPLKRDYRSGLGTQKRVGTPALPEQVQMWQTPHGIANTDRHGKTGGGGGEFHKQAMTWSTPRAVANVTGAKTRLPFAQGGSTSKPSLKDQAREMWPTPAAEPYGSSQNGINGIGGEFERPSANTPSLDRLSRSFLPHLLTSTDGDPSLPTALTSPLRLPPLTRTDSGSKVPRLLKPKLNPLFVEWLMGLPIGWTGSAPVATEWSRCRSRMRSSLCALGRSRTR